jgi:FkbM family methyltransferase
LIKQQSLKNDYQMNLNALTLRAYFAAREVGRAGMGRRAPWLAHGVKRLANLVLPQTPAWVQVRSGISQGLWMRLHLPDEARLWRGEQEVGVQKAILASVGPGSVVFDIGAHAGSIALGVARLVSPTGRVVAFEADPANVESLTENILRNRLSASVQVVHAAVWSCGAANIPFRQSGIRRSHGGVETDSQRPVLASGELISVPAITLDDFIVAAGLVPQLVKIDVEGGEHEVLRGGTRLFTKQRPLVIAEIHHGQAAEQIRAWLTELEYSAHWIIPNESFPCCLFAWPREFDGPHWMQRSEVGS